MFGNTGILRQNALTHPEATPSLRPFDDVLPRPWRIALVSLDQGVTLVFDLVDTLILGRSDETDDTYRIDLSPYRALELGVSRQHAILKLEKNRVYLMDNYSTNGVFLNNESLRAGIEYPLRHGDRIKLGRMSLRIHFLTNPFRQ
jgi:pSer/pThr/pTyr-binding forkhead associated (FHA) protein